MGDVLASRFITTSFSISGRETWSQGVDTNIVTVSSGGGAVRFKRFDEYQHILGNITAQQHTNIYAEEYNRGLEECLINSETLGLLMDNTELVTESSFRQNSKLASQLRQAAKVIMTRKNRTAERDLFYVAESGRPGRAELLAKKRPLSRRRRLSAELQNVRETSGKLRGSSGKLRPFRTS